MESKLPPPSPPCPPHPFHLPPFQPQLPARPAQRLIGGLRVLPARLAPCAPCAPEAAAQRQRQSVRRRTPLETLMDTVQELPLLPGCRAAGLRARNCGETNREHDCPNSKSWDLGCQILETAIANHGKSPNYPWI